MQNLLLLKGDAKHYDWGGMHFIPSLLQIENPNMEPFAEYWMGVHPQAKCKVETYEGEVLLTAFIDKQPKAALGENVYERFGNMPFLLKVLDVKNMLSIQVHPSKAAAVKDYERENAKGIPLYAANRNYKDANHKPELMVALSDFYLLHGFKPEKQLKEVLAAVPELHFFLSVLEKEGYRGMYRLSMEMPQEEVNEVLQPLLNRIVPLYQQEQLSKESENFWAARAALTFDQPGVIDRGIFSVYFFNLLHLKKGQAIFQDAGLPHAYLEGQNVEIMANSDNVLRGGLTTKHIDTVELLKHTVCKATHAKVIENGEHSDNQVYNTVAKDFELSSFKIPKGKTVSLKSSTAEIFLLIKGASNISSQQNTVELSIGKVAAVAIANTKIKITALEDSLIFRASVPE